MSYTSESEVENATGIYSALTQRVTKKSASEVTTLINGFITKATKEIRDRLRLPIVVAREYHKGDGEKNIFDLKCISEENWFEYDPENNLEAVKAVWFSEQRKHMPYPEDCEQGTENNSSDYGTSNVTVSDEETIVKAGSYSLKAIFSASGYIEYPSAKNLNKNIDIHKYNSFWLRTNNKDTVFTLRLYDKNNNYNSYEFTLDKADIWYDVHLKIDDFDNSTVDWEDTKLYYWRLYANGACTIYLDNFNFNNGWMFTAPEGLFIVCIDSDNAGDEPPATGYPFWVTYTYDPFKSSTPANIDEATACLAGIRLIDHLRGKKSAELLFDLKIDPDIVDVSASSPGGMLGIRTKLEERAEKLLAGYGYQGSYGVIY